MFSIRIVRPTWRSPLLVDEQATAGNWVVPGQTWHPLYLAHLNKIQVEDLFCCFHLQECRWVE